MDTATARTPMFQRAVFEDGLGTRHYADAPGGEPLEVLEVRDQFSTEAFERALRERVTALGNFHSTWFTQVRTVQCVNQGMSKLFVVYDRINGSRLSSILATSKQPLEVNATLCLIRQLVAAVALLHEKLPNMAHGAISPDRVIITPKARLVVSDYVLGAALEQLQYTPDQYWDELRVPLPNELEPTFDQRADVMQIGVLALELILGRQLQRDEYPVRIHELTERAWADSAAHDAKPLPAELRTWLLRMLQLDTEQDFVSAVDAWENLEHVLLGSDNRASFLALEAVVTDYLKKAPVLPASNPLSGVASIAPVAAATPAPSKPKLTIVPPPAHVDRDDDVTEVTFPEDELEPAPAPAMAAVSDPAPKAFEPIAFPMRAPLEEPEPEVVVEPKPAASGGRGRWVAIAAVIAAIVVVGAFFGRQYLMPSAAAAVPGTLVVTTNPAGFQVFIDGQPRGVTPLTLELAAGAHELKIATDGEPRIIPVNITAGSTVAQTIELPKAAPRAGQLMVRTDQPGVRVKVDGTPRGVTPLTIDDLTPGAHSVTLETESNSVTQDVSIEAGTTASLVVPMTISAPEGVPVSGWISVDAPAEVQVYEEGRLLGSSKSDRIMVSAGKHAFDLVNETLGYRITRTVTVTPGKVSALRLEWPKGSLALNAQPWADVWIGGERIGETPIGNVTLPIGVHEVTFRHPDLGNQVVNVTVTATAPTRVTVDMRKR